MPAILPNAGQLQERINRPSGQHTRGAHGRVGRAHRTRVTNTHLATVSAGLTTAKWPRPVRSRSRGADETDKGTQCRQVGLQNEQAMATQTVTRAIPTDAIMAMGGYPDRFGRIFSDD